MGMEAMNQEALRQHNHYASVRERLWPHSSASAQQLERDRKRQTEAEKKARIAAYRLAQADAAERAVLERRRIAKERKAERTRIASLRALAKSWPKWADIEPGLDLHNSRPEVVGSVLKNFPGITFDDVMVQDHSHRMSAIRAYVMYALYLKIDNQSEVARMFGRDPSTVNWAIKKVNREIARISIIDCPRVRA
jgi:hypothetical protein